MDSDNPRAADPDTVPLVLIADNDEGVSAVLAVVLDREGLGVVTAQNGEDAFETLKQGGVDALVCDLDMPKMSGEELLAELQSWETAPPIVVISGFLDSRLEERLGALRHVRAVLRKPFDVFGFGAQLRELVRPMPSSVSCVGPEPVALALEPDLAEIASSVGADREAEAQAMDEPLMPRRSAELPAVELAPKDASRPLGSSSCRSEEAGEMF